MKENRTIGVILLQIKFSWDLSVVFRFNSQWRQKFIFEKIVYTHTKSWKLKKTQGLDAFLVVMLGGLFLVLFSSSMFLIDLRVYFKLEPLLYLLLLY